MLAILSLLSVLAAPQNPGDVVINELSYDDSGTDDFEYVELYNKTNNPIDVSGWVLQGDDSNGPNLAFTINPGTIIPANGFFVIGSSLVPNVNQAITNPGTGLGQDLFENGNHDAIILLNGATVIDRVDYETYGSTWNPPGLKGQGIPGAYVAVGGVESSLQRYTDGYDTGDNGHDFRYIAWTPGTSNNRPSLLPYFETFDGKAPGTLLTDFGLSFVQGTVTDPQLLGNLNPLVIPASPQGGNAGIFYDPTGGGNTNMLLTEPIADVILECYAYLTTTAPTVASDGETWMIGVRGSTDAFGYHTFIDPRFATITGVGPGTWLTGATGIAWVYQRTQQYITMWLVDFDNGGNDFRVLHTEQIQAGVNDGWQRLKIRVVGDRVEGNFGGTYGQNDGVHVSARTTSTKPGGVYIGYREFLLNNPEWRPITLDFLSIIPAAGGVRFSGQPAPTTTTTPQIDVSGLAFVGNQNFKALATQLVPNSAGAMLVGFTLFPSPLNLQVIGGQAGSFLYVNSVVSPSFVSTPNGTFTLPLALPANPALAGAPMWFQAFTLDPALPVVIKLGNTRAGGVIVGA
jgi:hypothetical protein